MFFTLSSSALWLLRFVVIAGPEAVGVGVRRQGKLWRPGAQPLELESLLAEMVAPPPPTRS
jgi:hypothetical protein